MLKLSQRNSSVESITVGERFRIHYGDIEDLALSMRDKGLLQPIIVDRTGNLLAGGRRLAAAKYLKWDEIGVVVRESDGELDQREIELIENIMRKDLHWSERCLLAKRIHELYTEKEKGDWTLTKTAELLDRSIGSVHQHLQLAEAMEVIPELRDAKTEDEANKRFNILYEGLLLAELAKRKEQEEVERVEPAKTAIPTATKEGAPIPTTTRPPSKAVKDTPLVRLLGRMSGSYIVGDAFEGLAELPDEDLHLKFAEVDPPFAVDLIKKKKKENFDPSLEEYHEVEAKEYPAFLDKLTEELFRVLAPNANIVFWFGIQWYKEVYTALTEAGFLVDPIPAVWKKTQGQTNQPQNNLARAYETFFYGRKPKSSNAILTKQGRLNVFEFQGVSSTARYHPTQKPLPLLLEIIGVFGSWLPEADNKILVPFLGSGSTLIAANNLGYPAFGWDLSADYKDKFLFNVQYTYEQRFRVK